MESVIAAGKKMNEDGAFKDYNTYSYGNVAAVLVQSLSMINTDGYGRDFGKNWGPLGIDIDNDGRQSYSYTQAGPTVTAGVIHNVNTGEYRLVTANGNISGCTMLYELGNPGAGWWGSSSPGDVSVGFLPITDVGQTLLSLPAYGDEKVEHHSGSIVDWTQSDEEIERQIKEVHETWDVSEHEGATTANGTYVLAGPIEYNPGD
jgi:hypothetical protein